MNYPFLNPGLEKRFTKITVGLLFSFGILLYMHRVYRKDLFRNQGLDIFFFRNHSGHSRIFSQFSALFSQRISKPKNNFDEWRKLLNPSEDPQEMLPPLAKIFPPSLKSFYLRWNSLTAFMHALRLENILPQHRIYLRNALFNLAKKKILTRTLIGKEVRVCYSSLKGQKSSFLHRNSNKSDDHQKNPY